jgi:hypothetical protein
VALYGFKFEIAEMVFGGASRESGRLAHGHVKPFAEAVGSQEISYQNTKSFIDAKTVQGSLDLGNWGRTIGHAFQNDGNSFDCKGPELAVHFALNNAQVEGSVIMDQVSQLNINVYVQRAG